MSASVPVSRVALRLLVIPLALMLLPGVAAAHSELVSSEPALGTVVPPPYLGPIVLTFSEHLATGSKADLIDATGTTVATAVVDGNAKTMTFPLTSPLARGAWQVAWVTIADDGDLLRDIVRFTVASSASATSATAIPQSSASPLLASVGPSAAPSPSPSTPGTTTGSGVGDVVLPIVVALIVLGTGAAYLLTRRPRPPDAT